MLHHQASCNEVRRVYHRKRWKNRDELSHVKSNPTTGRCAICHSYPPWVPRWGTTEGRYGEMYDGAPVQTGLPEIHVSTVRPRPPESEGGHVRALEDEGCSDQSDKPKDPEQNARGQLNGKHGILDDLFCLVKQSEDELAFSFSLTKVYRRGN